MSPLSHFPIVTLLISSVYAAPLISRAAASNTNLIKDLISATTVVDRIKSLLANDLQNFVFNFVVNTNKNGAGGRTVLAKRDVFPAIIGTGVLASMGFIEPCGLNTAHTHPRASELLAVVEGTLQSGFILENGLTSQVNATIPQYSATVYPQGSIHYQFNPECEQAVFVGGFNSEDPGSSQIAQNFFALDPSIINATLGFPSSIDGKDMAKFKALILRSVALGVDSCLKKCNITSGN